MRQYRELADSILTRGYKIIHDRTGVGTLNLNGAMARYVVSDAFPIVTLRKTPVKGALAELVAFLNARTRVDQLGNAAPFWEAFGYNGTNKNVPLGTLGPIYGAQMRNFNNQGHDQLNVLLDNLRRRPYSRRHVVSYYNPLVLPNESLTHDENIEAGKQVLPPCHLLFQCIIRPDNIMDLILYQRSADVVLGVPANLVYYSALLHILAEYANCKVGEFIHMIGCAHIYLNHVDVMRELLREPEEIQCPRFRIRNPRTYPWDYKVSDFEITDYTPGPVVPMPLAV